MPFYPMQDLCQKPNTPFISFFFIRRNKYTWALAGNQYRKGIYTVGEENKKRVVEKKVHYLMHRVEIFACFVPLRTEGKFRVDCGSRTAGVCFRF